MTLTAEELDRHARHIMLKEIGGPGVQRLREASVSIIGAGALGGPCAMYLAAAGVGRIELWDDDVVERSNLQRQVQFGEDDLGASKVERLAARLSGMNHDVSVSVQKARFTGGEPLAGGVLIDATDNYPTRFTLNETAHRTGRRLVSGAAARWTGQVAVFESGLVAGAPCYRCFVPEEPPEAEACEEVGVVGPVTGIVAARMALEALKLLVGAGEALTSAVWIFEGLSGAGRVVKLRQDAGCPVCSG